VPLTGKGIDAVIVALLGLTGLSIDLGELGDLI